MNKNLYRLVFNRALGVIQVVAEIAKRSGGKGPSGGDSPAATLRPLSFALWAMLGFVSVIPAAFSQVVADSAAPGSQQPTVLVTPNGVPLIDIQTPSAAGVSRNIYSQFNIDGKGAILNNARTNAQTQLAGWIGGNPWLATGTAKVILNEVNGPASQLGGYIEIGGERAQLVIANPAGITCSSCGFINASRLTLTTGMPIMGAGGSLDGYRVEGGRIGIDGNGLDATRTDYTAIIARSLQLSGGIWANQLQATLGTNAVSADAAQITATTPTAGTAPAFALDSSALGGMYAEKITLLGTEHGVGVRNAGALGAQAGELIVTVDGRLENTGTVQARTDTHVSASGGVANAGTLAATQELTITTLADVDNSGGVLNAQRIQVDAAAFRNRNGSVEQTGAQVLALNADTLTNRDGGRIGLAAPTTEGGAGGSAGGTTGGSGTGGSTNGDVSGGTAPLPLPEVLPDGALHIAGTLDNDAGYINSGGGVSVNTADGLDNSGGHLGVRDLGMKQGDLGNTGGELSVAGNASLHVNQLANDGGRLELAGALDIAAQSLSNRAGVVSHSGTAPASVRVAGTLDNSAGVVSTNADSLVLQSGVLVNEEGRIEHAGTGGMTLQANTVQGANGTLATNSALTFTASQVEHQGATLSAGQYAITANGFDNRGGTIAASGTGGNTITVADALDNGAGGAARQVPLGGTIASNGDLTITASTFGNADGAVQQAGTGTLAIQASTLNGAGGSLASNGALKITGETTDLRGGTMQGQRIAIDTGTLTTAGGTLVAASADPLTITARRALDNSSGQIATNGALQLNAGALTNTNGVISAAGTTVSTVKVVATLENSGGSLAATGGLTVAAQDLVNQGGTVQTAGALRVTADGRLDNSDAGMLASGGDLALTTPLLDNTGGTIQSAGEALGIHATTLNGLVGSIASNGALTLGGDTTDLSGGTTSAQSITIDTGTLTTAGGTLTASGTGPLAITARTALDNSAGEMATKGALQLTADALTNVDGSITAVGTDASTVQVTGGFENTRGVLATTGPATVHAGQIVNTAGTMYSTGDLAVTSDGDVINRDAGRIQTDAGLTLTAGGALDNSSGVVDAAGAATVSAGQITNTGGRIVAGAAQQVPLGGTAGDNSTTLTISTAGTVHNHGGTIGTRGGDALVQAGSLDNGAGGTLVSQRDLTLDIAALRNAGGTVYATHTLRYENAAGTLNNAGGQIGAGDTAWLALAQVGNSSGGRIQAGTVWLTTPWLDIADGEVAANQLHADLTTVTGLGHLYGAQWLDANVSGDFTYANGQRFESDGLLDLNVAGTFTNQGTLQTAGELDVAAANLINQGTLNASNADGTGVAQVTVAGSLDNRTGASIEGDTVAITATDVTNTGDIVGNGIDIEADTLTNGRDLGTAMAVADYGEGFIGAAQTLDLRIAQSLRNLDAEMFSGGELSIAGRTAGTRVGAVENLSGRIQAEGDLSVAADSILNQRRLFVPQWRTLTPAEQTQNTNVEAPVARYRYDDPDPAHQAPNITPAQVVDQAEITDADATCDANWDPNHKRCIGDRSGSGSAGSFNAVVTNTATDVLEITASSAEGQMLSGGDMSLDTAALTNNVSRIAAGGNLFINAQSQTSVTTGTVGSGMVTNTAWTPLVRINRTTDYGVQWQSLQNNPRRWVEGDYWIYNTTTELAELAATTTNRPAWMTLDPGSSVASSITAGNALAILASGDVTNTSVTAGGGLSSFGTTGGLAGPGSTGSSGGATGPTVSGTSGPASSTSQVVGTPEHPLPGLVPTDNGMFDISADPNSPFLVTTAPRFAGGYNGGSNYLLSLLGLDTHLHKRLGDGYYEQRLVMEQILQLTGRRSLNGGDGASEYRNLMEIAAQEAGRLGLTLGVPLTSSQIAALDRDIVWLVEMEVNGQKVLTPVVYLSKATADRLAAQGALMAGDTLDIQSSAKIHNDGTLSSDRGTWLSADTLINDGAILSRGRVDITTVGDAMNRGAIDGQAVAIDAGGSVVNAIRVDGIGTVNVGTINAGTGGLQITAAQDVINQGTIASAGHGVINAGRDFVQNTASVTGPIGLHLPSGSFTTGGSAVVTAGRDVVLDQSSITAGQHAVIDAGRDAHFTAANVKAEGSIAVTAGRDIVSDTVTTTESNTTSEKRGKTRTTTTTVDETVHGSMFEAGGNVVMDAGHDITLTAATVNADEGAVALSAGHDVNLLSGDETHSLVVDTTKKKKGLLSSSTTRPHDEVTDTYAIGTTVNGETVQISAGNDYRQVGSAVMGEDDVRIAADHDVVIESAQDTLHEAHSVSKKKSGFSASFSGGVASVGYGKSSSNAQSTTDSTLQVASTVASTDGNVTVTAGNRMTIASSDLAAGGNLTLSADEIALQARQDTVDGYATRSSRSSGVSVGVTLDPTAAYRNARDASTQNMPDTGTTLNRMSRRIEGEVAGTVAAITPVVVQAGSQKSNSSEETHTSDARVSQLAAGGNLTLLATDGSITSEGAQMSAEGDAVLLATDDIVLDVAHHLASSGSADHGSGWSFANNSNGLPVGTFNQRGNGNGQTDTITGTQLSVGGRASLATTEGDITLTATNLAAQGDVNVHAAGNLTLQSGQDTATNGNTSDDHAIGTVVLSDTERFMGYHTEQHRDSNAQVSQVATTVGSLGGNVNLSANGRYLQTASNVVAAGNVDITAQSIELNTANESFAQSQQDESFMFGVFARVRSPLIDLINNVDAARESDGRLLAMQGTAAVADAYQSASAISSMAGGAGSGTLVGVEAGVGFARSDERSQGQGQIAQGSTISGGGNVTLTTTQGDLQVTQGNLSAGDTLTLDSARHLILEAGQSTGASRESGSHAGAEIGMGMSVGAQTGYYIYAQANWGDHSADSDSTVYNNTQLVAQTLNLRSQGDTTLTGATGQADTINVDTGGSLSIESLQDRLQRESRESGGGARVQVSFGTAWEASGYADSASAQGSYQSVGQQSGLFAGDGGFQINVAGGTNLIGGIISSSQAAIDEQRNRLTTATLTTRDLQNRAYGTADSAGLTISRDMLSGSKYAAAKGIVSNAVDRGASEDSDAGWTRSAISQAQTVITDEQAQQALTGRTAAETLADLNTDTVNAHARANMPDLTNLQAKADTERFVRDVVYQQAIKYTNEAYREMFLNEAKFYEVTKDPETGKTQTRELTAEEKANLEAGPDGKVNLATNGIFNGGYGDPEAAATYALQHNAGDGPLYLVHFPQADNGLSELLIAGYQKFLENDFWGLTNATTEVLGVMEDYGQSGLYLDGHSRGAMTIGNAMESLKRRPGSQGSLSDTTISFFGPAYNAAGADDLLGYLQNRGALDPDQQTAMVLTYQNHMADFVGGLIGGNPATGGTIPEGSSRLAEMRRMIGDANTAHSCYGTTSAELCHQLWQTSPGERAESKPATKARSGASALEGGRGHP